MRKLRREDVPGPRGRRIATLLIFAGLCALAWAFAGTLGGGAGATAARGADPETRLRDGAREALHELESARDALSRDNQGTARRHLARAAAELEDSLDSDGAVKVVSRTED